MSSFSIKKKKNARIYEHNHNKTQSIYYITKVGSRNYGNAKWLSSLYKKWLHSHDNLV